MMSSKNDRTLRTETALHTEVQLAARAGQVLRRNDMGDWTLAAPDLYLWGFDETRSVHGLPDSRPDPPGVTSSSLPFVPKPIRLLRRILQVAAGPNALVLDPFAGSGTTARAVLEQNASDGGARRFVLIEADDRAQALIPRNLSAATGAPPTYGFYTLA